MALDLYLRRRNHPPGRQDPEVLALSERLRHLGVLAGLPVDDIYRNANGVESKLYNFAWHDPGQPSGRSNGGRLTEQVWNEFAARPADVHRLARQIQAFIDDGAPMPDVLEDDPEADESTVVTRAHRTHERDPSLRAKKIADAKRRGIQIACVACGFDFAEHYGARGIDFIEVHHITPVSDLLPGQKTRLSDLTFVCANCHRDDPSRPSVASDGAIG